MKRRNFVELSTASALAVGASAAIASSQANSSLLAQTAKPSIRWRIATSWPKSLQILFETVDLFCQQVNKMTNGRFVITPYPAGELADGLKVLQAVQDSTVECGHTASYYYLDQGLALAFGTTLPFGLTASQQNAWLYYGGGLKAMQQLYAPLGIINFPGGNTGTQMGGWFKKEVNTISDFQGLRIRIPGLGGKIMERLGAKIQVLPGDRIFEALLQDQIDAAEWKNPHADKMLGLHKVAPIYYHPGWWEPGTSYEFQVNRQEWDKLPKSYQAIFKAAATDANEKMLAKFNSVNGGVLKQLSKGGTRVLPFSRDILKAAYQTSFELYEEYASRDKDFRTIYEKWQEFRANIYAWNELNELGFARFYLNK